MTARAEALMHSASSLGRTVDALFLSLLGITALVAIAVAGLIVFFAVRYRAGSHADRSNPPTRARWIEIAWTVTPLAIFIGLFVWSSVVFSAFYRPPANAMRIHVLARQWMWKLEHADGRREIDELHVPAGQPVELIMTSQDVIHSFFVPAFRVKQDVLPGRYTSLWFTATRPGTFNLFCAEYCGADHSNMHGSIVVMRPADSQFTDARAAAAVTNPRPRCTRRRSAASSDEPCISRMAARSLQTTITFATPSCSRTSRSRPASLRRCRRIRVSSMRKICAR
jgi:cytochrome c oxidase subunit 2